MIQSELNDIKTKVMLQCDKHNIAYDIQTAPVKIGPDVYMFYGTQITEHCRKYGQCKVSTYYALVGGDACVILDSDMTRVP
jgi:hypothetical protein